MKYGHNPASSGPAKPCPETAGGAPYGTLEKLHEVAQEHLNLAGFHIYLALDQGHVGSMRGRNYNYLQAAAHMSVIADVLQMEAEHEAREAQRRAEARAR